jgi:hypothetical protein
VRRPLASVVVVVVAGSAACGAAPSPSPGPVVLGEPGCGLDHAAFCDTFDAPASNRGRAGELDAAFWTAGREYPTFASTGERVIGIGGAAIPHCRDGVPDLVFTDQDTLVCDPAATLNSPHLMVAVAAQNYGQNGYRIRQPFDVADRTGTIVLDAAVEPLSGLLGWMSLAITEDPIAVPSYAIFGNDEGTAIPRSALELLFSDINAYGFTMRSAHVFDRYRDTVYAPSDAPRIATTPGRVHRLIVHVSQHHLEVAISPASADGVTFGPPETVFSADIALPFTRGFVQLSVHNHASLKYSGPGSGYGFETAVDAAVARIDNVGFDGPVLAVGREYEVPDSLTPIAHGDFHDPYNPTDRGLNVGYVAPDAASGPSAIVHLHGVDLTGATRARLSLSCLYDINHAVDDYTLAYRVNGASGGAWHEHRFSSEELALAQQGPVVVADTGEPVGQPKIQGLYDHVLDVPLAELRSGDNTLEVVTRNVPQGYPPVVANINLVVD